MAAMLLSGCNAGESSGATAPGNAIVKLIVAGNADPSRYEIGTARERLIRRCMRAKGFGLAVSNRSRPLPAAALILGTGEFTSVPPESAALGFALRTGFGNQALSEPGNRNAGRRPPSSKSRRYSAALVGPKGQDGTYLVKGIAEHTYPTEGCVAEADRDLYGSDARAIRAEYLPEDLDLVVRQEVGRNPLYLAASKRWSACMAKVMSPPPVEPYALPGELPGRETGGSEQMQTHAYERTIAVRDARCQYRSGFIKVAVELRRHYALLVAQPYREALATVLAATHRAVERAESLDNAKPS
ncbi:MAG: hypothetical protein ACTHNP_12250 [Solirubrobacterales bacterium]